MRDKKLYFAWLTFLRIPKNASMKNFGIAISKASCLFVLSRRTLITTLRSGMIASEVINKNIRYGE